MGVELVEIPGVEALPGDAHAVRALRVDGRAPAIEALKDWKRSSPDDFKKIMRGIRLAAAKPRPDNSKLVVRDHEGREIYEIRAQRGNARLLYFYSEGTDEIVICVNPYWKTKPSPEEQERSFARCVMLRERYRRARRDGELP